MKWWVFQIVLVVVLSSVAHTPARAALPPQQKPLWHTNYEQAKEIARREDKLLFVVFR
jgi:hypothetical protein